MPTLQNGRSAEGPIGIAGAGRVAQALGRLLVEKGEPLAAVASRDPAHAEAAAAFVGGATTAVSCEQLAALVPRVLIAVPDEAVIEVAATLAEAGMAEGIALHTCGGLGPEALDALHKGGVSCGVIHPLQTVPTPRDGLQRLPGAYFAVSGDAQALRWAEGIVRLLGGQTLRIAAGKQALYHAAAVMASNHIVGLIDAACELMKAAAIEPEQALPALRPLVEASVGNAFALGPAQALTGPVERGDAKTVCSHLDALENAPPAIADLYRAAASQVLDLARRKGLPGDRIRELEKMLKEG